ncbi:hypothetical protein, partial [Klebsiella pneumoniae]|uniref:hypothetical protein n=1 Tax=Klebsiella pneumoniae TaxID=573 RepID=UPI001C6F8B85
RGHQRRVDATLCTLFFRMPLLSICVTMSIMNFAPQKIKQPAFKPAYRRFVTLASLSSLSFRRFVQLPQTHLE